MMAAKPHIAVHMVASLDGYIAKPDNSISWFESASEYEKGAEGEDHEAFLARIDAYVMGARTYELALALAKDYGWAYGNKPTIVLTHRDLPNDRSNVSFYAGDLRALVRDALQPNYKNVWVVGGAALTKAFLQAGLVDEIRISILPILLGGGIPYFDEIGMEQALNLKDAVAYKNGMVELVYAVRPQA